MLIACGMLSNLAQESQTFLRDAVLEKMFRAFFLWRGTNQPSSKALTVVLASSFVQWALEMALYENIWLLN